ncbi:zinc carboxypeptidase, partial [Flavobacteriaceae bacterium]|nr:zinc carboxypeptidase [Flavobacteriaceae bacterium]
NQPKGKMIQVLLEPQTKLNDSLTYDITSWSLPYAFGLEAVATNSSVEYTSLLFEKRNTPPLTASTYGYATSYKSLEDGKFLAAILKEKIGVRFNQVPVSNSGKSWDRGSLFILKGDNQKRIDYLEKLSELAQKFNRELTPITTGYSSAGPDLGAAEIELINAPRIGLLRSDRASSYSYGELWHFFEQVLEYPIMQVDENRLGSALEHLDQLILPSGYYSKWNDNSATDQALKQWIIEGGKIIAVAGALNRFANSEAFKLKKKENQKLETTELPFGDLSRNEISLITTGSVFEANMDVSHPLSFGLDRYYTLKLNEDAYEFLEDGTNAITLGSNAKSIAGFIGFKAIKNQSKSLLFGEERKGRGTIVYFVDNTLFRGFWYSGKMLFTNALFF